VLSSQRTSRLITVLAASVALGLSLAACGSDGGGSSSSDALTAKGPITVWYSNNKQELAWGKAMVAKWNAANPDQTVTGQEIPAGTTVDGLLTLLNVKREYTAVAVNRDITPKSTYTAVTLSEGDKVEIVRPMGGG